MALPKTSISINSLLVVELKERYNLLPHKKRSYNQARYFFNLQMMIIRRDHAGLQRGDKIGIKAFALNCRTYV